MLTPRVSLAALAAGIAMYFWAALAHMVLPLATVGISNISNNEPAVLDAMKTSLGNTPGFYHFPSIDLSAPDGMKQYDAKLVDNPSGILIYNPPGAHSLTPKQLVTEFLVEFLEAALAVFLLTQTRVTSFRGRVAFVALIGLLASLPTNVSYWNWYHFPGSYTLSYMFSEIVGFTIVGIVAAFILKDKLSASA